MHSRVFQITFFVVLFVVSTSNCNEQKLEGPMRDFNKCLSALSVNPKLTKDQCMSQLCSFVPSLVECRVLRCKKRFPGKNDKQIRSILRCIKSLCTFKSSLSFCQDIQKCESIKRETTKDETEFKTCIAKLFPERFQ